MKLRMGALLGILAVTILISCDTGTSNTDQDKEPVTYSVTYDGNGSTGGTVPTAQVKIEKIDLVLDANSGSLARKSCVFGGWNTAADGTGTDYASGATYTGDTDLKLYAKWGVSPELTIGFSHCFSTDPWHQTQRDSVKNSITDKSYKLVFNDANNDQTNQIAAVRDFIEKGVDAIILAPVALTGWTTVLGEAKAAGIPVILLGDLISGDETLYGASLTYDFEAEGRKAAEALVALKGTETVKILEIEGPNGDVAAINRKKGFDTVIAQHPSYEIVKSVAASWSWATAKSETTSALTDYPGINVVYAHNDGMALGAIDAIKETTTSPGTGAGQITVLGTDGGKVALQSVLDGDMYVSVECSPFLGQSSIQLCEQLLEGKLKDKNTYMNDLVYRKADLTQAFVDARGY